MSAAEGTVEDRARALLAAGDVGGAATVVLRALGPEVLGFLVGALRNDADADEVFAATSERIWRSLATFRWQCALRTWVYVIARHEIGRFLEGVRRAHAGRASLSVLDEIVAQVRTETRSILRTEKANKLNALRDELPVDDRMLLVLRVDRNLHWDEIARAFVAEDSGDPDEEAIRREAARLRKRFQLLRERLAKRAREEGLLR